MDQMYRDDVDSHTAADGTVTTLAVCRWSQRAWTPLEIKRLFTSEEWLAARIAATDVYESLTLVFDPIDSDTVATHIRSLIGVAITTERFTEITGQTP